MEHGRSNSKRDRRHATAADRSRGQECLGIMAWRIMIFCVFQKKRSTLQIFKTIPSLVHRGPNCLLVMQRQLGLGLSSRCRGSALVDVPPPFLAPSLHSRLLQCSSFSSTTGLSIRDKNKARGVSAIRRTGPRVPLGVSKYPLPKPVPQDKIPPRTSSPDHGLWGFFPPNREALSTPEYDMAYG